MNLPNCVKKNQKNAGFTVIEMVIVLAIMVILMALVGVGVNAYMDNAEKIERYEVAESSYYALQSFLAMEKRNGRLEEFAQTVKDYNMGEFGDDFVLSEEQNRIIIENNYEGTDFASYYADDYMIQHEKSEIVCMRLDAGESVVRKANPLYQILFAALKDEDVLECAFFAEFDSCSGIVRSVFFSKDAVSLEYHFAEAVDTRQENKTDIIDRNTASLDKKRQGYCGILETCGIRDEFTLVEPEVFKLVNNDRLYLMWDEANALQPGFIDGTYSLDKLIYEVNLYTQDGTNVASYELPRADLYCDVSGTQAGALDYIDDYGEKIYDETGTKTARAGYVELSYEESPDGIAGERYYLLLECLDHTFEENGYDFNGDDTIYATLSLSYKEDEETIRTAYEETVISDAESVYYAAVEEGLLGDEFTIAYSRHLWNVRNGLHNGDYRLIADIDWRNIEDRARDIAFTSTLFENEEILGEYDDFTGTLTGLKADGEGADSAYRYASCYEISGINLYEETNEQVGLFALNAGTISDVILSDCTVSGSTKAGAVAGVNAGTLENVLVMDTSVSGDSEIGGLSGYNSGVIDGCMVVNDDETIIATHTVGGIVGNSEGNVINSSVAATVAIRLPEGTEKISTTNIGRYVGGVVGYQKAGGNLTNLASGALVDETSGLPLTDDWSSKSDSGQVAAVQEKADVTGIYSVGGIVGEIETGAGEFSDLYNYAKINVEYVDTEERTARADTDSKIYLYYGGITGRVLAGNSLKDCVNYAPVALEFLKDGQLCEDTEIYDYISQYPANDNYYNCPRYIGGIAGYNQGTVEDCISSCSEYGSFEETLEEYEKVRKGEAGCYVGAYAGGLIGTNKGELLFTDDLPTDTMQVVVKAYAFSNGGLVGYAADGSIKNESGMLAVQGVVASRGNENAQAQGTLRAVESTGGIIGSLRGGEFAGEYTNDASVLGRNAGGITAYLEKGYVLDNCNNTGTVYGRGLIKGHGKGSTGGIVGLNLGTVTNCTNTGTVSNTPDMKGTDRTSTFGGDCDDYLGGVAGYNTGIVKNCHSKLNEDKSNYLASFSNVNLGGIVGYNVNNGGSYLGEVLTDKEEEVDIPIYVGASSYTNFATRVGGIIGLASGQLELSKFVYSGDIEVRHSFVAAHQGYGGIIGSLVDNKQVISDCTMKGTLISQAMDNGGVVGYMSGGGIIEETVVVTPEAYIEGKNYTGGVVGMHNVHNTESHIDIMENQATVVGQSYVGGIAGYVSNAISLDITDRKNSGSVTGSNQYVGGLVGIYSMRQLEGFSGCLNTGEVTGNVDVGGIVGHVNYGATTTLEYTVKDLRNQGTVTAYDISKGNVIGGLIGRSVVPLQMTDCHNEGAIGSTDAANALRNVGGLLGDGEHNLTVTECSNQGIVSGSNLVGGLVGFIWKNPSVSVTMTDCTNEKSGQVLANANAAGGMIGKIGYSKVSTLVMENCVNYAPLDTPNYAGGMVARAVLTQMDIKNCHNYGEIDANSKDKWTLAYAGGLIGEATGNATMEQSRIANCTQNANIYEGRSAVGGLIGAVTAPLLIENCPVGDSDKACTIQLSADGSYIGGLVGDTRNGLTLLASSANVDITGAVAAQKLGGLIGCGVNNITIGEDGNADTYCHSYGDILLSGNLSMCGGIAGYLTQVDGNSFAIYGSKNYGTIGANSPRLGSTGGIVGYTAIAKNLTGTGLIKDCQNLGQLQNAVEKCGGLVGSDIYVSLTVINSVNGAPDVTDAGKITIAGNRPQQLGGLIGYAREVVATSADISVTLQNSHNYGDICISDSPTQVMYVGGLIGTTCHNLTIGDASDASLACHNYGDIYGEGNAVNYYIGGIAGELYFSASQSGNSFEIYGSQNYGDIGQGNNYTEYVGGIIGRNLVVYKNVAIEGTLKDCVQLGQIYNAGNYASGIVGNNQWASLTIENCHNGQPDVEDSGNIYIKKASSSSCGGLIGSAWNENENPLEIYVTIRKSHNYGDICATENVTTAKAIGGLVGTNSLNLTIGDETDASLACHNYGDIYAADDAAMVEIAGIIALTSNKTDNLTNVYYSVNYGSLGKNASKLTNAGGIGGELRMSGEFYGCTNLGVLSGSTASNVGGIAGEALALEFYITNCTNGNEEDTSRGTISFTTSLTSGGGIIGGLWKTQAASDGSVCYIDNCVNYADIHAVKGSYIGGLVGQKSCYTPLHILASENKGDIYCSGTSANRIGGLVGSNYSRNNIYIGAVNEDGTTDTTKICTNYGNIYIEDANKTPATLIGGIIGDGYSAYLYGTRNEGNILPAEDGSGVSAAGGIAGQLEGTSILQDVTQMGYITHAVYHDNSGKTVAGGLVGIIGQNGGTATLTNCTNGSAEARQNGEKCGNIYAEIYGNNTNSIQRVGGLIGSNKSATVEVKSCTNYGDIVGDVKETTRSTIAVGGICGESTQTISVVSCENYGTLTSNGSLARAGGILGSFAKNITIESSANYADIVGEAGLTRAGGIVGGSDTSTVALLNMVIGNKDDATKNCVNYGKIYSSTGAETQLGGILGYAKALTAGNGTIEIYDAVNVSDAKIAKGVAKTSYIGGIVGQIEGGYYGNNGVSAFCMINVDIVNCTNKGPILWGGIVDEATTYSVIGGIAGQVSCGGIINPYTDGTTTIANCVNDGAIAWDGFKAKGNVFGGIAGDASGEIINCTNNVSFYAPSSTAGNGTLSAYAGGIVGKFADNANTMTVENCTNNGNIVIAADSDAARGVGGIVGWGNGGNYYSYRKHLTIKNCTNNGSISLPMDKKNTGIGGILGVLTTDGAGERCFAFITDCINNGDITGVYLNGGGIAGSTWNYKEYVIEDCINYGDISASNRLVTNGAWQQYGQIGGICGMTGSGGRIMNCINTGDVSGDTGRLGGLVGTYGGGYMINSYNAGAVSTTGNERDGALAGHLQAGGYILDCYSVQHSVSDRLYYYISNPVPEIVANNQIFWQAGADVGTAGEGYIEQAKYEKLCGIYGLTPAWNAGSMIENLKHLTSTYKYEATAPVTSNFVYTPTDTEVEGSTPAISWDISNYDFVASEGMEIYLYDSTMSNDEIAADIDGTLAFFTATANFANGKVPTTASVTILDEQLPHAESEYKIVIRTLGYSTSEGMAITEDTERIIQNELLTLPVNPLIETGTGDGNDETGTVDGGDAVETVGEIYENSTIYGGDGEDWYEIPLT